MPMYHRQTLGPGITERGAALVVSLILLLIMTIIGVAAMNGARLEVSMAGMMQREEVALRSAERTLAAAERYTEARITNNFDANVKGHYLPGNRPEVSNTKWSGKIVSVDKTNIAELSELTAHDAFVVEYQGLISLPGSAVNDGGDTPLPGDKVYAYRITARSDTEGQAVRIIESIYTKLYNPMAP